MAAEPGVASFGSRRREPEVQVEPDDAAVKVPPIQLAPVRLPVVLVVDEDELRATVRAVRDMFRAAVLDGISDAVAELEERESLDDGADAGPSPADEAGTPQ